jgi:hypothetical protein
MDCRAEFGGEYSGGLPGLENVVDGVLAPVHSPAR